MNEIQAAVQNSERTHRKSVVGERRADFVLLVHLLLAVDDVLHEVQRLQQTPTHVGSGLIVDRDKSQFVACSLNTKGRVLEKIFYGCSLHYSLSSNVISLSLIIRIRILALDNSYKRSKTPPVW